MILSLSLKAKEIKEDTIWDLMVLEVVIARLDIMAELGQVVLALKIKKAYKISNILLLESEET